MKKGTETPVKYTYIVLLVSICAIVSIFAIDELFRERHVVPVAGGDIFLVTASFVLFSFAAYFVHKWFTKNK